VVHHRVDGGLQLKELALTSTVIFLVRSPVATAVVTSAILRTWRSDCPHQIDTVGEILPRPRDAFDERLSSQLPFGSDLGELHA